SDATPQLSPHRPQRFPSGSPIVTLAVCARVTNPSHTSCSYPPARLTRRHRASVKLRSPYLFISATYPHPRTQRVTHVRVSTVRTRIQLACDVCGSLGVCHSWSRHGGD
ncbi:hypothetical protein PVAP13_5KG650207, partial [Panicum virgatum]